MANIIAAVDAVSGKVYGFFCDSGFRCWQPEGVECIDLAVPPGVNYATIKEFAEKNSEGKFVLVVDQKVLNDMLWSEARQTRTELLSRCDWTQVGDVALTDEKREEWRVYRQALRDVTTLPDITWPVPPN